ncbi:MAG: hypothetical protein ACREIQ_03035, partial [Nitrospiria bacterium]
MPFLPRDPVYPYGTNLTRVRNKSVMCCLHRESLPPKRQGFHIARSTLGGLHIIPPFSLGTPRADTTKP